MPLLSTRARPLLFSLASSASLTAAVVVVGAAALAAGGFADDLATTLRGHDAESIRLARVLDAPAPVPRAHAGPAATALPGGRPAPGMPSGRSAPADGTRTPAAEPVHHPRRTAPRRRPAHSAPKPGGAPSEQPQAARESVAVSPARVEPSTGSDATSARTQPPGRSRSAHAPRRPAAHAEIRSKARGQGHATQNPGHVAPSGAVRPARPEKATGPGEVRSRGSGHGPHAPVTQPQTDHTPPPSSGRTDTPRAEHPGQANRPPEHPGAAGPGDHGPNPGHARR